MPLSADLLAIKKKFAAQDGVGRTTEKEFWSSWESLVTSGFSWPLAVFVLPDGVGLQLHFQPSNEEFPVFVETKSGHEFMHRMKEEWHAQR